MQTARGHPRRLRHYEGPQPAARDARGWRDDAEQDVLRVEEIDRLVGAGMPVDIAARIVGAHGQVVNQDGVGSEVLDEIAAYYRLLDARARCLERNRDALAAWLAAHGMG